MSRQAILIDGAPLPGGAYSQGVVAGGFLYTAGFGPQDPETGLVVGDTVAEQTRSVLRNISAVLAAHGLELDDVVKSTVHLSDLARDFADFNTAYAEHFNAPYPARTTVGSVLPGILVEIDVVAALRG
jgi:2-iminobutanoate/2-iminopropanoate deaminase